MFRTGNLKSTWAFFRTRWAAFVEPLNLPKFGCPGRLKPGGRHRHMERFQFTPTPGDAEASGPPDRTFPWPQKNNVGTDKTLPGQRWDSCDRHDPPGMW